MTNKLKIDTWKNCYPSNWNGLIVKDAIAHPAKYSSKLIRRIYEHIAEEGWVGEGDSVFDMFGGVALGALDAMRLGLRWCGVELEPRFHVLGNANIALWNSRFSSMPHWCGDAVLLNGDSRRLDEIFKKNLQMAAIASPPFGEAINGGGIAKKGYQNNKKRKGSEEKPFMIVSKRAYTPDVQAGTDGNLSVLPATQEGFALALSSPPYADSIKPGKGSGFDYSKLKHGSNTRKTVGRENIAHGYGDTYGNLGSMTADDFSASISSPPFLQNSEGVMRASKFKDPEAFARAQSNKGHKSSLEAKMRAMKNDEARAEYGDAEGQLGNEAGENFWSAARTIIEQTYIILKPGGHAVWVVKDFVKNKKIVPFCDQWRQLCESVGFITVHEHHATLIRDQGISHTLEGGEIKHIKSSKSFFRRVAESKGSPAIDYEVVYCMEKPA